MERFQNRTNTEPWPLRVKLGAVHHQQRIIRHKALINDLKHRKHKTKE